MPPVRRGAPQLTPAMARRISPIMSPQRIMELYPDIAGYIREYRDWAPVIRYDTNTLAAAVIPATQFFDSPPIVSVCNLERQNEVPYRTIVLGWTWQVVYSAVAGAAPTIADALVIFEECELELEKDGSNYPSWPTFAVPGGGGVNAVSAPIAAGAATQNVSNGLGNSWRYFYQPIVIDIEQTFRVFLRSSAVTALGAQTDVTIGLVGIEARRPI